MLWNYKELEQFIAEDFEEFLEEGLSLSQVTEKLLVEYHRGIVRSNVEKLVVYLTVALLSLEKNYLREDIQFELNSIIDISSTTLKQELAAEDAEKVLQDIEKYNQKLMNGDKRGNI
ncbi:MULTISPECIES: hypothetical protein [Paenibacillus]|uniref:Immunity protein Imm3 n=1 Tax=Paenibacillus rhizoplanae TaxID=1917181 RepID=A0ABW5FDZ6_9BACL